jgi:mRNA interferase YafQ
MRFLTIEEPLPSKNRNHKLKGDYVGYWECHIEPDWLLVYKKTDTEIIFARIDRSDILSMHEAPDTRTIF